jgi:hypothetical protein
LTIVNLFENVVFDLIEHASFQYFRDKRKKRNRSIVFFVLFVVFFVEERAGFQLDYSTTIDFRNRI